MICMNHCKAAAGIASSDLSPRRTVTAHGDQRRLTSREVVRHTVTIVREFGPRAYLRCCAAMFLGRRTTFLACVFAL
jgi:hypothetical protein